MNPFNLIQTSPSQLYVSENALGNYSILVYNWYYGQKTVRLFYKYSGVNSVIFFRMVEEIYVNDNVEQLTEQAIEEAKIFAIEHFQNVAPEIVRAIDFDNKI